MLQSSRSDSVERNRGSEWVKDSKENTRGDVMTAFAAPTLSLHLRDTL